MGAPLTFIEAANGTRLSKHFSKDETRAYPNVKTVNSYSYETDLTVQGLRDRFELIQLHARQGHCMLKGKLQKQLRNESRAGLTDKLANTNTLILDIDGLPVENGVGTKLSANSLQSLAEIIITKLPPVLHNVSYIAHASASLGRNVNKISLHIEFLLERAVQPRAMKLWIQHINLTNSAFSDRLTLSNSGHVLHWIVDPSVADNSKLIFIAPPTFDEGVENPFDNDDDRFVLVEKSRAIVDLTPELATVVPEALEEAKNQKLNRLRKAVGLKKFSPKMTKLMVDGREVRVISNPDRMTIQLMRVDNKWAIFNVNNGDSNAYYCPLDNPTIIYNFKGEQPFEFEKADPDMYEAFCKRFELERKQSQRVVPMVIRDAKSDTLYHLRYDQTNDRIALNENTSDNFLYPISRASITDFMTGEGYPVPDTIPTWDVVFDPHSTDVLDGVRRKLNSYSPPVWVRNPPKLDPELEAQLVPYERGRTVNGALLQVLCPTIYKIMWNFTGSAPIEFEHFINWFAFCYNERRVSTTAWIFSGVPGTGKGVFASHVLMPLVGFNYAKMLRQENLEDNFNNLLAESLFLIVDEFRLKNSKQDGKLIDYIKNLIVSDHGQVRQMHREQRTVRLFFNMMFFSNHYDVIEIEEGDRRFNVAPPQRKQLFEAFPEVEHELATIHEQIPLFAAFLDAYPYSEAEARRTLENDAKSAMKQAAMSPAKKFCYAARTGDLDYFIEYAFSLSTADVSESMRLAAAQRVIRTWIADAIADEPTRVSIDDLRAVYHALNPDQSIPQQRFSKLLTSNDLQLSRMRVNGVRAQGYIVKFFSNDYDLNELMGNAPTQEDQPCITALH